MVLCALVSARGGEMTEIYVLDGRSVAEAHLYMDIRGCEMGRLSLIHI